MKVDLVSIKKVIAVNNLKKVTNPIIFERGAIPTEDGLLSTEIFGVSSTERKETFAYIDLHGMFFTPTTYKRVKRLDKRIEYIVNGSKKYIIDDTGELVESPDGKTGLDWLYKNWDKIKFKRNKSTARNERIDFLEAYGKDIHFTKYWLVCPAFYRDVNFKNVKGGKIGHNNLTDLYSKLLRYANMLENTDFDFVLYNTQFNVQQTLVEIYDYFKGQQEKKTGNFRKNLLGKSVDYGVRAVISAPTFNYKEPCQVDFRHSGIPLSLTCSLFFPFLQYYLNRWFEMKQQELNGYYDGEKIQDLTLYYNEQVLKKQVDKFIFSYSDRFEKVKIPFVDESKTKYFKFVGEDAEGNLIERDLSWCDILYQSAYEATINKHVWITRYPILDYQGTFPTRVAVSSTKKTMYMKIGENEYKFYPYVDYNMPKNEVATFFIDTVSISNVYLPALDGDYDGDQVTVKAIFSQEANEECEVMMKKLSNILSIEGKNVRQTTKEGIQTIYMLTKFENE